MNIALEETSEWVAGVEKNRFGDAFIRGNNVLVSFVAYYDSRRRLKKLTQPKLFRSTSPPFLTEHQLHSKRQLYTWLPFMPCRACSWLVAQHHWPCNLIALFLACKLFNERQGKQDGRARSSSASAAKVTACRAVSEDCRAMAVRVTSLTM